jgi:hypothetical protein
MYPAVINNKNIKNTNMKNLIAISILFMLFTSCTKFGKNVTVKGKVVNPVTGMGIEGIEIQLQRGTLGLPGGNKSVKNTFTDANGDFEISKLGLSSYTLRAQTGVDLYDIGWFENGEDVTGTGGMLNVKRGKTMHVEYRAVPYGTLNLKVKNTNCFNSLDKIEIYYDGAEVDSKQYIIGKLTELTGCIDITDSPIQSSIGKKYFHWISTKNSIQTTVYDTFYVQPNQNTEIQVFY